MSELSILAVCGIVGGLLCAAGDVLLDLKGPGNEKLGTSGSIDPNWVRMSGRLSFSFFGPACLVGLGYRVLSGLFSAQA